MIVPITVKFKIERNFVADVYPQDLVSFFAYVYMHQNSTV